MRRYVTDAGPLLPRLHRLTRSDCTTRNARKAAAALPHLRRAGGADRAAAVARRSWRRSGPELDGNQIAEVLGIPPGPVLGRAYKYLLSVRMDQGPIGPEAAAQALREWWATQPESAGSSA